MKSRKISILLYFVLIAFFLVVTGLFFSTLPASTSKNAIVRKVEVPTGTSVRSISKNLKKQKLIRSGFSFYLCGRFPLVKTILTLG